MDSMPDTISNDEARAAWVAAAAAAYEAKLREVAGSAEVQALAAERDDFTLDDAARMVVAKAGLDLPNLPASMQHPGAESADVVVWGVGELAVTVHGPTFPVMEGTLALRQSHFITLTEDATEDEDGNTDPSKVGTVRTYLGVTADNVGVEYIQSSAEARDLIAALEQIAQLLEASERVE